jgi:voltage-gated potassium channel Kch
VNAHGHMNGLIILPKEIHGSRVLQFTDMIRNAEKFGFKIYYGDGCRLDILHASGAATAQAIVVCVDIAIINFKTKLFGVSNHVGIIINNGDIDTSC